MTRLEWELEQRARRAGHGQPTEHVVSVVAGTLILSAVVLALSTDTALGGWQVRLYVVVTILGALALYGIGQWDDGLGRLTIVLLVAALLAVGTVMFPDSGLFSLWGVVTGLAVAALSLPAGAIVCAFGTLVVACWHRIDASYWHGARVMVAIVSMWGMYGVIHWLRASAQGTMLWAWHQFERAQGLLREAREGRAELYQALDDLAHANRQLALANENLAAMRRVAEDAQRAKAAFVSKVSHELRTPLNMIIGLADLPITHPELYEAPLPPTLVEDLRIVRRNSQHLLAMVNDVLDLSQVEAGQLALYREAVDFTALLRESAEVVGPLLTKKGLSFTLDVEEAMVVYCDATRIRQVVLNLVSNAARFTERGGITVTAHRSQASVVVAVQDTGPGIPPEDAARVFEPFYQSRAGQQQGQHGTGLGLSISRQFVEQHGGRMWLESAVGKGSTFRFDLPISDAGRPRGGADRWVSEEWPWVERRVRASVPLVDAAPRLVMLDTTGDLVSIVPRYAQDVEFVVVNSAAEAVRELRQGQSLGGLVNTPDADALWPTVEAIAHGVPFVPLVGCSFPPSHEHATAAGALEYLTKPLDREVLVKALERLPGPVNSILVVDDDPDSRLLLERMLRIWRGDLRVVAVESGERALAALEEERFDAVLLDIIMPGMDGWQVPKHMHERGYGDVPVIIVSAQDIREKPLATPLIMISTGQGISLGKVLRYTAALLRLMYAPLEGVAPDRGRQ